MSLADPIVVWTAAFVGTLFTGDPCPGIVLAATIYYALLYPMGVAPLATDAVSNWDNVTRMFFFTLYGSGSALSCAWLFNTPVLIPAHGVDESVRPLRRKLGVYTLFVSPVTLVSQLLWLAGMYAPSISAVSDTVGAGLPIEAIYVLTVAFALLSVFLILLTHRDTLAGNADSTLAITRYGAMPGERAEGTAIIAYVWIGGALVTAQALWYVAFPLPWVLVLIAEAAVLALAYVVAARHFPEKARWGDFVALLATATILVAAVYASLVGTVITTLANVDWLLWALFILLALLAKFWPVRGK